MGWSCPAPTSSARPRPACCRARASSSAATRRSPTLGGSTGSTTRSGWRPPGEAVARAGDRTIWLVWSNGYRTHEGTCQALVSELAARRPGESVLTADEEYYEKASLYRFDPT